MASKDPQSTAGRRHQHENRLSPAKAMSIEEITCNVSTTESADRGNCADRGRGNHGIGRKEFNPSFWLPGVHALLSGYPCTSASRALLACSDGQQSNPRVSRCLLRGSDCERIQPTHRKGFYLPCDEEEKDLLDFLHKVFSIARRSDAPIHVPHPENGRVLDLGCGTGIWAIDVAERYPDMFVVGVDLSPIQPDRHPPNCEFYAPFDFERQWEMGEDSWDVVHLRMGWGSVSNWPSLYRRVFTHLRTGGWFEQVEIDFEPRFLTSSSEHLPLRQWYQAFECATAQTMRPLTRNPQETFGFLQTAGFAEICHQTIQLPLNQWPPDPHQRETGRWYGRAFLQLIEAIDLGSLNRTHGLITQAKLEASDRSIHSFHVLHVYRAQKPPSARSCSSYKCRRHEQTYVER